MFDPRDDDARDGRDRRDNYSNEDCDGDSRQMGRGPGSNRDDHSDESSRARDARWLDRETRQRDNKPREVFSRHVNLPHSVEREIVRCRDREYSLRESETRTLATVGAFRVVSSRDLRDYNGRAANPRSGDLRHLREEGLIETVRAPGHRDHVVVLTKEGRTLLEQHRARSQDRDQTFYAGLRRERELAHDVQVYRAYEHAAERLQERGARIDRVVLDYELKREYQKWLHARDAERDDYDGHPDRTADEVRDWALEHDLPYFDDEMHFPDVRIEYQDRDGRWEHEDIEVITPHYRGAHAASVARAGFSCYGVGTRSGKGGGRGGGRHPRAAEELWL